MKHIILYIISVICLFYLDSCKKKNIEPIIQTNIKYIDTIQYSSLDIRIEQQCINSSTYKLPYCNIELYKDNYLILIKNTDINGHYLISNIQSGKYKLKIKDTLTINNCKDFIKQIDTIIVINYKQSLMSKFILK